MAYAVNRRRPLVDPLGAPLPDPAPIPPIVRPPSDLPPPVGPVNTTQPVAYPGGSPGPTPSGTGVGVQPQTGQPPAANAPNTSRNAPRLTQANGQWTLSEHGNTRPLQPAEVPDAQRYVEDFWQQFPTGFQPGVGPQANDQYTTRSTTSALSPTRGGTGASNYRYGGYDFNQDPANRDISSSAKYMLAELTRIAAEKGVPMPQTKDEAEAFALAHLVPGFEAAGYNIRNVQGDSFTIDTRENDNEVIDWLVNAGSTNPDEINIGWQSDVGDVNAGSGQGLNAAVQSLLGMPGGSDIFAALMSGDGLGSSDLMRRIQAELQKLLTGQSPSAPNAPLPGGGLPGSDDYPFGAPEPLF